MFCTKCNKHLVDCPCPGIWPRLHSMYDGPAGPACEQNAAQRVARMADEKFGKAGWTQGGELKPINNHKWICYWCFEKDGKEVDHVDMAVVNIKGIVLAVPCCGDHHNQHNGKLMEKL